MIRDYRSEDLPAILSLLHDAGVMLSTSEIEAMLTRRTVRLYDDGAIRALLAYQIANKTVCLLSLFTAPSHRRQGIARLLWQEIQPVLAEQPLQLVVSSYQEGQGNCLAFYEQLGMQAWYTSHLMHYTGPVFPEPELDMRLYDDEHFDTYRQLLSDSFYNIRLENDIRPHLLTNLPVQTVRQTTDENRNSLFLLFEADQLIGSAMIKDHTELDFVFTAPHRQGLGYGRKIVQYTVNRMIERGIQPVSLSVLDTNKQAERLYCSLGFQRVQTTRMLRMTFPHAVE